MAQRIRFLAATGLLLFASVSAFGHHSAANRATEGTPISWQGTVAFVSWDGAHVMYKVEVQDSNGVTAAWEVQGGSPKRLASRGIYQKTVNAGDTVTVTGYLNRHNRIITPVYLATSEGRKLFVGYVSDDAAFTPPTN
jgi:hypothetical protein